MAMPSPPASRHKNIVRGRRFSISSRSTASSFGFRAARNASPKKAAFTAAVLPDAATGPGGAARVALPPELAAA